MNEEQENLLEIAEEGVKKCEPSILSFFQHLINAAEKQFGKEAKGVQVFYFLSRSVDYLLYLEGAFFGSMLYSESKTDQEKEFLRDLIITRMKTAFTIGFNQEEVDD